MYFIRTKSNVNFILATNHHLSFYTIYVHSMATLPITNVPPIPYPLFGQQIMFSIYTFCFPQWFHSISIFPWQMMKVCFSFLSLSLSLTRSNESIRMVWQMCCVSPLGEHGSTVLLRTVCLLSPPPPSIGFGKRAQPTCESSSDASPLHALPSG